MKLRRKSLNHGSRNADVDYYSQNVSSGDLHMRGASRGGRPLSNPHGEIAAAGRSQSFPYRAG